MNIVLEFNRFADSICAEFPGLYVDVSGLWKYEIDRDAIFENVRLNSVALNLDGIIEYDENSYRAAENQIRNLENDPKTNSRYIRSLGWAVFRSFYFTFTDVPNDGDLLSAFLSKLRSGIIDLIGMDDCKLNNSQFNPVFQIYKKERLL